MKRRIFLKAAGLSITASSLQGFSKEPSELIPAKGVTLKPTIFPNGIKKASNFNLLEDSVTYEAIDLA